MHFIGLKGIFPVSYTHLDVYKRQGVDNIMAKAGSRVGEKTILDALAPAVEELRRRGGEDLAVACEAAAAAAGRGSESTKEMKSVHGRAAYYAEKSIGVLDGGSVVGKLIFEGIADSVKS